MDLVKNPVNPDVALWLGGIERLYGKHKKSRTHSQGFSSYGKSKYRNQTNEIAVEVQNRFQTSSVTHHTLRESDMIFDTCQMALDLNFDGLMIESHWDLTMRGVTQHNR